MILLLRHRLYGLAVNGEGNFYAFRYDGSIYTVDLSAHTINDTGLNVSGEVIFGATYAYDRDSSTALYGTDTFTYTITDEHGESSTTTLTINITDSSRCG
jgi:hypothetical protein